MQTINNKIISRFYVITLHKKPVYVGYTNRPIEQRFTEHKHDKDFGNIDPEIKQIAQLEYNFTWDTNKIDKYANEVNEKECELIQQYNTQNSKYQKANGGGQNWSDIKNFVNTNHNNPKFRNMSESDILKRIKSESTTNSYLFSFISRIQKIPEIFIKHMISDMITDADIYLNHFISNIQSIPNGYIKNFVNGIDEPITIYLKSFILTLKTPIDKYLSNFINDMYLPADNYIRTFTSVIQLKPDSYMYSMTIHIRSKVESYMISFIHGVESKPEVYLSNFVNHMSSKIDTYLQNFINHMFLKPDTYLRSSFIKDMH